MNFIDLFLHLDHHMNTIVQNYGAGTYLIVFLIIFCETGLVVTPFLPGDSLLFVLGALAATGPLKIITLMALLSAAAILGNTTNYWIGTLLAARVLRNDHLWFLKQKHLERTRAFYAKYGNMTIIITRFVPIIRTIAPFLAGVGNMNYWRFAFYNIIGGILWINCFLIGGYFFGNLPAVKKNFSCVVFSIVLISLLPIAIEFLRQRQQNQPKK